MAGYNILLETNQEQTHDSEASSLPSSNVDRTQAWHEQAYDQILTLTTRDLNRHQRALLKIHEKLFQKYRMQEYYFIIPESLTVISPQASFTVLGGEVQRTLSLGGISYEFLSPRPETRLRVEISHCEGALFNVFVFVTTEQQRYTRLAATVEFSNLDEELSRIIKVVRAEFL